MVIGIGCHQKGQKWFVGGAFVSLPRQQYHLFFLYTLFFSFQFDSLIRGVSLITMTNHTTTILRPFFQDHPGEPVPEENFWTLWCKGRLTEADTDQPDERHSIWTNQCPPPPFPIFYRPDALPAAQPTVSKHRSIVSIEQNCIIRSHAVVTIWELYALSCCINEILQVYYGHPM